jgi:hypothetical protein
MEIKKYKQDMSVCKVTNYDEVNMNDAFVFIGKTDNERSLVCETEKVPQNAITRDDGWKMMRIQGVLDFSLIGILAKISTILANHQIGIFVISTFNTDYILVKKENYDKALKVLENSGYIVK